MNSLIMAVTTVAMQHLEVFTQPVSTLVEMLEKLL